MMVLVLYLFISNQQWIEKLSFCDVILDQNQKNVLMMLLQQTDDTLYVYPTENYYYFRFPLCGKEYWGNINFSLFSENPFIRFVVYRNVDFALYDKMRKENSPVIIKFHRHQFSFTHKSIFYKLVGGDYLPFRVISLRFPFEDTVFFKTLLFYNVPQIPSLNHHAFKYIFSTFDESGFSFQLYFNRQTNDFSWIFSLSDQIVPPDFHRIDITNNIFADVRSGFVFKQFPSFDSVFLLIGVSQLNVSSNNWYDGPFDQLNDREWNNKLDSLIFVSSRYRGTKTHRGYINNVEETRVALGDYVRYIVIEDLLEGARKCHDQPIELFNACLSQHLVSP